MSCDKGCRRCHGCPFVTECYYPPKEVEAPDEDLDDSQLVTEFYSAQLQRVMSTCQRTRQPARNAAEGKYNPKWRNLTNATDK